MLMAMPTLDPAPKPIQSIYTWFSDDELYVNRRYQRKLVWTLLEKQQLIQSIMYQYPVPAILLAERAEGGFEIIDGLQRLYSIVSFIENGYPTLDGKYFDVAQFPTAKLRADEGGFAPVEDKPKLSQREVSSILDYVMAITVMRNATDAEIDDVFRRINTYGHRLSDQERRQSGVQNEFSEVVRTIASTIRGDVSSSVLGLDQMPSVSVDLPMNKHGYVVQASEVFWVNQGILRSTELRDSMDEQYIADIVASVVGGSIIERSKSALDEIYEDGSMEGSRVDAALQVYGADKISDEFKFVIGEVEKLCAVAPSSKLREILFPSTNTNAFPSVFATLFFALHELLVHEGKMISDYAGVRTAITGLATHLPGKATTPEKRRRNADLVKGLIAPHVVAGVSPDIYGSNVIADIDGIIRRSQIELPHYELKQGILTLHPTSRAIDPGILPKIAKTITAIANNGRSAGVLLMGITDKKSDMETIKTLDGIEPRKVGPRFVVGIKREADFLGESLESYYARVKQAIRDSDMTQPLKNDVLSAIDFNDYFGLGVIVIPVPPQNAPSLFEGKLYWRNGDDTVEANNAADIVALTQRFS